MKIAILGIRGIPANYGGFETFVDELSTRLAARGHDVTVYCRTESIHWEKPTYKGVKLVKLPTLKHKYFDTIAHTFLATLHVIFTGAQVIYYCNSINSIFALLPRILGRKTVINVDGLEWKRAKWNRAGKLAYQVSEWIATFAAHEIISDSRRIRFYYKKKFNRDTQFIGYGADIAETLDGEEVLAKHGLQKRNYFLTLTRLEPENNVHVMIEAYEQVKTDMPLVIIGDAPYAKPYIRNLRSTPDPRVKFLGGIYELKEKQALQSNAYLYLHGNEVGGTNPSLLEAMATGNCVIANGVRFNREVLGDAGLWYKPRNVRDLKQKMEGLLENPKKAREYGNLAVEHIRKYYNWEDVVDQYERFFNVLTGREIPLPLP